jgi:uncharacterized protein YutE (UPF0331/DUF86 family)
VASKLAELAEHVARRTRRKATVEDLRRDRDALDLVAFNLMLAVQACADVASHVIADEGWPPAMSLGAAFERLRDHGVISEPSVRRSCARSDCNVIAHGYAGVRPEMVQAAATTAWASRTFCEGRPDGGAPEPVLDGNSAGGDRADPVVAGDAPHVVPRDAIQ